MWSSRNRSKMMLLLTTQHYRQLAVIVTFAAFAMQTLTMASAQNPALSSTTPKLVNGGALATAATNPLSNCSIVRSLFESQGINGADIPQQPITGKFFFCFFFYFSSVSLNHHGFDSDSNLFSKYQAYVYIYLVGRPVSMCRLNFEWIAPIFRRIQFNRIFQNFVSILLYISMSLVQLWTVQIFMRVCVFPFQAILCMKRSIHSFLSLFFASRSLRLLSLFLAHFVIACIWLCRFRANTRERGRESRMRVNTKFDFSLI